MEDKKILEVLESVGLNKNEIMVYLDLIKSSDSSANDISKRTKIHRPNVYDILRRLRNKGLAVQNIKDNKKIFHAVSPKNLLHYHKQKEYDLKDIIPEIEKIYSVPKSERKVSMVEGLKAIRNILDNLLELKEEIYTYGCPNETLEEIKGFLDDFHKRRIQKKIEMKHIYSADFFKRIKELQKMKHTGARYNPSFLGTEITTNICENKVVLISWDNPTHAVIIENPAIADAYKTFFEIIWEDSHE